MSGYNLFVLEVPIFRIKTTGNFLCWFAGLSRSFVRMTGLVYALAEAAHGLPRDIFLSQKVFYLVYNRGPR